MLYWIIYLIDVITPLKDVFIGLTILGAATFIVTVFFALEQNKTYGKEDEDYKKMYSIAKHIFTTALISLLLAVFIPSKTTAYTLLGIKLGQVAVSKPEVQNKVDKLSKIIDIKLDQYIQETGSKK